jgi:hypothetical protein
MSGALYFTVPKGCVQKQSVYTGGQSGFELEGAPKGDEARPIIIRNCNFSTEDIILPVSTLSSEKILYTFGQDFGQLQILGTVFLGTAGEGTPGLGPIIDFYNEKRVDVSKTPVFFSMPGEVGYAVYITSLVISQADPDLNTHDFAYGCLIGETSS